MIERSTCRRHRCLPACAFSLLLVLSALLTLAGAPPLAARPAPAWETLGGPFGGAVTALATTPGDCNRIVVVAGSVLFRSDDCGGHWTRILFPKHEVGFVAVDSLHPPRLWASGTDRAAGGPGSFTSGDGGATWTQVHGGPFDPGISGLVFAPSDSHIAYGVSALGVFRSDDRGATWTEPSTALPFRTHEGVALAVDPRQSSTLFAATAQGVFKSADGGASWSASDSGITSPPQGPLLLAPGGGAGGFSLYVGTGPGGVFKSDDGGTGWRPVNRGLRGLHTPGGTLLTLAFAPSQPTTLYAAVRGTGRARFRLLRSDDGGESWRVLAWDQAAGIFALAVDPVAPDHLFVAGSGLFQSIDGGLSFEATLQGLAATAVRSLALEPRSHVFYAVTDDSTLQQSRDAGATWQPLPIGGLEPGFEEPRGPLAVLPGRPGALFVGVGDAIAHTADGGATWTILRDPQLTCLVLETILPDPFRPDTLFVSGAGINDIFENCQTGDTVLRSRDGGATWTHLPPPENASAIELAAGSVPGTLYAAGFQGVLASPDRGNHWRPAGPVLPHQEILSLAVSPATPTLYVATRGLDPAASASIYRSTNGGASWRFASTSPVPTPFPAVPTVLLAVDSAKPAVVYAYGGELFFRSTDGGATWQSFSSGLAGFGLAGPLLFDPRQPGTIYAGGKVGGMLRLRLP